MDNMQKPILLGRLFRAFLLEIIDYPTFEKLATAVVHVKIYNVPDLVGFYTDSARVSSSYHPSAFIPSTGDLSPEACLDLANCGLMRFLPGAGAVSGGKAGRYERNRLGKQFVEIAMERKVEWDPH
jgi:hypothetical protein